MRAVVQRTGWSEVSVNGDCVGRAAAGLTVLLGVGREDDDADVGHALVADVVEDRVELHAVLDDQVVGLAAQREQAREHGGPRP